MSCRVQKLDGTVEYTLPNKKESQLFKSLKAATENNNEAERFYNEVRSAEFKKWYGKDWEKDYTQDLFTDENGEPKLVIEEGFYSFKNGKGETFLTNTQEIGENEQVSFFSFRNIRSF